jgi:hypothetical protein
MKLASSLTGKITATFSIMISTRISKRRNAHNSKKKKMKKKVVVRPDQDLHILSMHACS